MAVPKYSENDIEILDDGDATYRTIRRCAWMYSATPRDPLKGIITGIVEEFDRLDVSEFRVSEGRETFLIEAKQDWLAADKPKVSVKAHFNSIISPVSHVNGIRSEVFLNAFYFRFYTKGFVGAYGDEDILNGLSVDSLENYIGANGRFLIISKQRNIPEEHKIIFER